MTERAITLRAALLRELAAAAPDGYMITTQALLAGVRLAVSPEPAEEEIRAAADDAAADGLLYSEVNLLKGRRWGLTALGKAALAN